MLNPSTMFASFLSSELLFIHFWITLEVLIYMQVTMYIYSSVYSYKYHFLYINSSLSNQILRDDAVKVLHSICQQIWKTQQWPPD